jgi:hypothetical protein
VTLSTVGHWKRATAVKRKTYRRRATTVKRKIYRRRKKKRGK